MLNVNGLANRHRYEADELDTLLEHRQALPGTYGVLYDRSDNDPDFPGGPNALRVRAMARGQLTNHPDPFFSPSSRSSKTDQAARNSQFARGERDWAA